MKHKNRSYISVCVGAMIVLAACAVPQAPAAPAKPVGEAISVAKPEGEMKGAAKESASLAVMKAAEAKPGSSAAKAIELAKKYAGSTINVTWEAGLQSQDPLLFSAVEFERLTGVKVKIIETPFVELFSKAVADHQAGGNRR